MRRHIRFGYSSLLSRRWRVHLAKVIGTQSVPCCEDLAGGEVRRDNGVHISSGPWALAGHLQCSAPSAFRSIDHTASALVPEAAGLLKDD